MVERACRLLSVDGLQLDDKSGDLKIKLKILKIFMIFSVLEITMTCY